MSDRLTVLTFLWGDHYGVEYLDRLAAGVHRHCDVPYRFACATDRLRGSRVYQIPIKDLELTKFRGCFCRLRVFDPDWQREALNVGPGDRILVLDLDLIITGKLAPIVQEREPFTILQGVNSPSHPCRFNGSVWLTTGGYRPDVWTDFTLDAARELPILAGGFVGDQEWFQYKMPDAGAFTEQDGVWAFHKGAWPVGYDLPENARIVAFPGKRDPAQFAHLPWIRRAWLGTA